MKRKLCEIFSLIHDEIIHVDENTYKKEGLCHTTKEEKDDFIDFMLKLCDIYAEGFNYLLNEPKTEYYWYNLRSEKDKLNGNIEINDDLLVFHFEGHQGHTTLIQKKDISEVEKDILSGGGYINPFTTYMIVIEKGKVKHFQIVANNKDNKEVIFDKTNRKDRQNFDMALNKDKKVQIFDAEGNLIEEISYFENMKGHFSCLYEKLTDVKIKWI